MFKNFSKNVLIPTIIGIIIALILKIFVFQIYTVNGKSMQPTFEDSNLVFGLRFDGWINNFNHSDIVIAKFNYEDNENVYFIKRLIALEGDTLEFKNSDGETSTEVYVNGEKLNENYILEDFYHEDMVIEIPQNKVYLMGDNRNNSSDSRILGFFDIEDLVSTVKFTIKK